MKGGHCLISLCWDFEVK
ncbi:hypothetical protein L3Q82_021255 [Scortum barcoo]|uniref:Uncharacterized protein n=1 Tax=Scortum barcoo TaxID=214431 RepID=A0ACB8X3Y0_9TELE|nr:hypothetical protein L3Q82_021255 [Scortum barcoo]